MRLSLIAAAISAALLAGCAAEGTYYGDYGSPYYGYDYGPSYGPTYYGPDYYSFYYRSGDGGYRSSGGGRTFRGSTSFQGSAQTPSRSSSRTIAQPRARSNTHVAQAERRVDRHERVARQPSHIASETRTGPDREHGG